MTVASEQLRQTQQLIDYDPTTVVLQRKQPRTKTAAGGRTQGDEWVDLDPQTVFFGAKVRDDLPLQDSSGERVINYYTLVGMPGLDIQNGDRFSLGNITYHVMFVHLNLNYEVKADVESYSGGR